MCQRGGETGGGGGAGEGLTATAPSTVTLQTEDLMALQLSLQQEFNYITFVQRNIQINYIKRRCLNKLYAGVGTISIQSSCLNLKHLLFMAAQKRTLVHCYSRCSTALHSRRRSKGKLHVLHTALCDSDSVLPSIGETLHSVHFIGTTHRLALFG